ncbi:hypothetical protein GGS24DRAFT_483248 [Hypoxylon argillaceum]|nr:hypothetical protein GGS24DRAFT_483248 [Hypoxylon argillaceum]
MDKKGTSPELLQAEPLPTQKEQVPPSRKRQIDNESDTDDKPQLKRARLTRRNLARFNKMDKGKKKESKSKKSSSSHRDSTSESQKTKTTSTTTSGFAIQAYKNGIPDPLHSKPPTNLEDLRKRHARSRETASPPETKYKHYVNNVGKAVNKATMVQKTSTYLLKDYDDDESYNQSFNQSFTGFPDNVGFNNGLSAPQPDFVEGLEMEAYDPVPIDEYVSGAVLYKNNPSSLTLPHLAGEWKSPSGNMGKARLQSSYDGAALVYARNQALSYMGRSDPPGHAEVTTFTTDGTTLNQYAHYAEETEDGKTKYHQYRIKSTNLIDSYEDFKAGRRGLRNLQDHARNQSYALRDDLQEYYRQHRSDLQPIAKSSYLPVPDTQANPYEDTNPYPTGYATTSYQQASYEADTQYEDEQYGDEADYEVVDEPYSERRSSTRQSSKHSTKHSSSKASSSKSSHPSEGHKRKASQPSPLGSKHESKHSSKPKDYWKLDKRSGRYYHRHSDGRTSWYEGEEDDRD